MTLIEGGFKYDSGTRYTSDQNLNSIRNTISSDIQTSFMNVFQE